MPVTQAGPVELHTRDFITALDGCRLTLISGKWDQGLMKIGEPATFRCRLTPGTWDNIAGLTEPFTEERAFGYQWLDDTDIALLLSCDGQW